MSEIPLRELVDWISFTVPTGTEKVWPDGLSEEAGITKSFNGYDTAKEYIDGRAELVSSTRPEMGIHCVMAGQTCSNLRDNIKDILNNVWKQRGHVTRFDIAFDDYTGRISPRTANELLRQGKAITRAKQTEFRSDPRNPGETQYFGRFSSEILVRIYDKDAEQKIYGFRTRIEVKYQSKRANKAAKTYLQGEDHRGLVLGVLTFKGWKEWDNSFKVEPIKVLAEKTSSKRITWLLTQCAKSMAKEILDRGGDLEIMDKFYEAVLGHMSDIRQKDERYTAKG